MQCGDKTNCAQYGTSFCTNPAYTAFAHENCPKHCNLCSSTSSGPSGKLFKLLLFVTADFKTTISSNDYKEFWILSIQIRILELYLTIKLY